MLLTSFIVWQEISFVMRNKLRIILRQHFLAFCVKMFIIVSFC